MSDTMIHLGLSPKAASVLKDRLEPDGTAYMDDGPDAEIMRAMLVELESQLALKKAVLVDQPR